MAFPRMSPDTTTPTGEERRKEGGGGPPGDRPWDTLIAQAKGKKKDVKKKKTCSGPKGRETEKKHRTGDWSAQRENQDHSMARREKGKTVQKGAPDQNKGPTASSCIKKSVREKRRPDREERKGFGGKKEENRASTGRTLENLKKKKKKEKKHRIKVHAEIETKRPSKCL